MGKALLRSVRARLKSMVAVLRVTCYARCGPSLYWSVCKVYTYLYGSCFVGDMLCQAWPIILLICVYSMTCVQYVLTCTVAVLWVTCYARRGPSFYLSVCTVWPVYSMIYVYIVICVQYVLTCTVAVSRVTYYAKHGPSFYWSVKCGLQGWHWMVNIIKFTLSIIIDDTCVFLDFHSDFLHKSLPFYSII